MSSGMLGSSVLVTISKVKNVAALEDVQILLSLLDQICKQFSLTVVQSTGHQFLPKGASAVKVLAESHIAVHTWPEIHSCTLDVHLCGKTITQAPKRHYKATMVTQAFANLLGGVITKETKVDH